VASQIPADPEAISLSGSTLADSLSTVAESALLPAIDLEIISNRLLRLSQAVPADEGATEF
jgi:hypothetical protein